ncbi:MAG TPA: Gmad2 immunoglobulin-like domain-containing protein, partial [Acidimicrobiia bacterium]
LMARMVAMSPEPPEFPQEIEMTQPANAPRRSPALIFAVAAAAVVALALPLLLFQGTAGEDPAGTTAPDPATTLPGATPTTDGAAPSTTHPAPVPVEVTGVVYLVQDPENSFSGNPALVPLFVTITDDTGVLGEGDGPWGALAKLTTLGVRLPEGLFSVIPEGVEVATSQGFVPDDVRVLNVNEAFLEGAGGLLADITMLNQIVYTATYDDPDALVLFSYLGAPIEAFGSEGLSLADPVGRDSFLDELNLIILTQPLNFGGDGLPQVEGRANVFEAALTVRIVDVGTGETLYEELVMATCGTGCWGDFAHSFDTPLLTEGTVVEIFWYSAEDGEPANVVTLPVIEEPIDLNP